MHLIYKDQQTPNDLTAVYEFPNPEEMKFVNDPEADSMLTRAYREPYALPAEV